MANITITQLPTAAALTGSEPVPIVQNGVTVQTTTGAISGAGALNYPFLTVGGTAGLTQARYLAVGSGLGFTDGGIGSTYTINLTGAVSSLLSSSTGIQVKTSSTTISAVSIAVGSGLTVSNAAGIAGNPTISLGTTLSNVAAISGTGLVTTTGGTFSQVTLAGTNNQITITNGTGSGGNPTFAISTNAVFPGLGSVVIPAGNTAARVATGTGAIRFNTDTSSFEGYNGSAWTSFIAPSSGVLPVSQGGTGASTLTGYVYGNGTSAMTASTTIPTTALSGSITNAQLANSTIKVNGTTLTLGDTNDTITASSPFALTIGTGLSGTSYNGSAAVTIALNTQGGVTAGTYGSGSLVPVIAVNAQGVITSISTAATNAPAYQGIWNANTNTPTLTSSVGTAGYYYVVSVAGNTTLNGVSGWNVGDWAIFENSVWQKVPGSSSESFTNLTTTNLAVTGLTGYMYANGSSNVTATTTIAVANGGTGLNTLTTGYIPYGNGTGAFSSISSLNYNATNSAFNAPTIGATSSTSTTPALSFNASNSSFASGTSIAGSYLQAVIQNTSATAGASVNYVLSNNLGSDSSYYGEFGMNSSVFSSGTPTDFYSINNGVYFSGHDGDISVGSGNGYKIYFPWGSTGASAHVINASGALGFSTNLGITPATTGTTGFGTSGQALVSAGSAAAPAWGSVGLTGGGTNASLTAVAGGVVYSGASALAISAAGTAGQVLVSNGTSAPSWSSTASVAVSPTVTSTTTGTTITPNANYGQYEVTALATSATIAIPTGTTVDGQKLIIRIKDNGTAQSLTWTTSAGGYRARGVTLPATTTSSTPLYAGCVYNSQDSFWDVLAIAS